MTSNRNKLINDLAVACEELRVLTTQSMKGLSIGYRSIGERIICYFNPKAHKDGRRFSDMTEAERQSYRDTVEGVNRKTLEEIGAELVDKGFANMSISGTTLYNAMRVAVAYSDNEVKRYVERGAGYNRLVMAASLESAKDRDKALSAENIKCSVDEFRALVEEIGSGGGGIKPASLAGKKAVQTKKELAKEIVREAMKAESKSKRKEKPSKAPGGTDRLDKMISKFADHLDDRLLGQMADIAVVWDRDYAELAPEDKVTVAAEVDRLEPLLLTLAASLRMIYANAIKNNIIPESRLEQLRGEIGKAIA